MINFYMKYKKAQSNQWGQKAYQWLHEPEDGGRGNELTSGADQNGFCLDRGYVGIDPCPNAQTYTF